MTISEIMYVVSDPRVTTQHCFPMMNSAVAIQFQQVTDIYRTISCMRAAYASCGTNSGRINRFGFSEEDKTQCESLMFNELSLPRQNQFDRQFASLFHAPSPRLPEYTLSQLSADTRNGHLWIWIWISK